VEVLQNGLRRLKNNGERVAYRGEGLENRGEKAAVKLG
jgi:hypothetical protein